MKLLRRVIFLGLLLWVSVPVSVQASERPEGKKDRCGLTLRYQTRLKRFWQRARITRIVHSLYRRVPRVAGLAPYNSVAEAFHEPLIRHPKLRQALEDYDIFRQGEIRSDWVPLKDDELHWFYLYELLCSLQYFDYMTLEAEVKRLGFMGEFSSLIPEREAERALAGMNRDMEGISSWDVQEEEGELLRIVARDANNDPTSRVPRGILEVMQNYALFGKELDLGERMQIHILMDSFSHLFR